MTGILLSGCGSGQFLGTPLPPTSTSTRTPTFIPISTSTPEPTSTSIPTNTSTPTQTPVSEKAFPICPTNQWQNCEVPLKNDLIDPSYFEWLNTIPVEFPEGTTNKPLEFVGDDPVLDPATTRFNLTAGHALTSQEALLKVGVYVPYDELIYPVAIWSDSLQKPVWIVIVWSYVDNQQSETFTRGGIVPLLEKAATDPKIKISVQCNYLQNMSLDPLINAFVEANPDIDIQEAKLKFAETGDPAYLPKNTVFFLHLSKFR
jgi:hypothetical protein